MKEMWEVSTLSRKGQNALGPLSWQPVRGKISPNPPSPSHLFPVEQVLQKCPQKGIVQMLKSQDSARRWNCLKDETMWKMWILKHTCNGHWADKTGQTRVVSIVPSREAQTRTFKGPNFTKLWWHKDSAWSWLLSNPMASMRSEQHIQQISWPCSWTKKSGNWWAASKLLTC